MFKTVLTDMRVGIMINGEPIGMLSYADDTGNLVNSNKIHKP